MARLGGHKWAQMERCVKIKLFMITTDLKSFLSKKVCPCIQQISYKPKFDHVIKPCAITIQENKTFQTGTEGFSYFEGLKCVRVNGVSLFGSSCLSKFEAFFLFQHLHIVHPDYETFISGERTGRVGRKGRRLWRPTFAKVL